MRNQGIGSWPARRARLSPEAVAISQGSTVMTYPQLRERVDRLAGALRTLGLGRGDRVAVVSPNHPAHLETLFAAGLLGAVFVPINARLTANEIAYQLADAGVRIVIHAPALTDITTSAAAQAGARIHLVSLGAGYENLITSAPDARTDEAVDPADMCIIMYTSGTTGRPKGVVLNHHNVLMAVLNAVIDLDLRSDEAALVSAPLFHTGAMNMVALPTILKGGRVVVAEGFDPAAVLDTIENERITHFFGVPTMLDMLTSHPAWTSTDLSSLRRIVVAAAPVPQRTLRAFTDRGITMCQGYGLTESGPGALILPAGHATTKLGTAGVPHFFTDVRIVTATGDPAAPGECGEIQISGPNVMVGYWNRPDAYAEALTTDGWLRSGDVGVADGEGFITIVDRLKDMIISGGENVYPAEIEAQVMELPVVDDCAVFGIPDEKWGEVPCAAVTLKPGGALDIETLTSFLAPRVARYKIPKALVVTTEIPRNATGKIRKAELRDRVGTPTTATRVDPPDPR